MRRALRILGRCFAALLVILAVIAIWAYEPDIPAARLEERYASDGHSQFMALMGMRVHFRDQGPRSDSLPLVLVHGTSSSLHTWDSLVAMMSAQKRLIRMDLPAFGLTGPHPAGDYSIGAYNRFLDSFLTRLGVDSFIMAGNSLGGAIAWNHAVAYPGKVRGLILVNAGGYPRKDEKGSLGFKLAAMPVVGSILTSCTPRWLIRKSIGNAYYDPSRISEETVTRYHEMILREGNRDATLSLFRTRNRPSPERIRELRCPTLVLWGRHDQLISVDNAAKFGRDIPGARVVVLENSGHVPMEENPVETAAEVRRFLSASFEGRNR